MPEFDGKGPNGKGPMTGCGDGFCLFKEIKNKEDEFEGFAGIGGKAFKIKFNNFQFPRKEVIKMPSGDRTGPMGAGPRTGRGAGYCSGYSMPGYANQFGGRGFARGGGRGFRNRFYATGFPGWAAQGYGQPPAPTEAQELEGLKQEAEFLKDNLNQISQRISQLEKEEK